MTDHRAVKTSRSRTRRAYAVLLLLLGSFPVLASHHLPNEADPELPETAIEIHAHARIFYSIRGLDLMAEYVGRFEDADREFRYQSVTLGGYVRVLRNLKAGLFYRLQFNARHDDDWIEAGTTWLWADTSGRPEHVVMVDLTPRVLLAFLPGGNWTGSLKSRYEYNLSNSQQSLLVRPGLTWFLVRDREPILNVSAQYATYFSLNFGAVPWYQHGPYLNVLYHLSQNIKIDVGIARQWIYWSESQSFLADFPDATYAQNVYSPWLVDAGMVLRF